MGSSLCKPRDKKPITTTSWVSNDGLENNPFESSFSKKERICLRETYQRLNEPKEVVGRIFVEIVYDLSPNMRPLFGVERVPKATMLRMPKLGGHVSRMVDFFEQMTTMIGFTENLMGALQLVRKTGRLHAKIPFLEENQNQQRGKNYFTLINDHFIQQFIPYLNGTKKEEVVTDKKFRYSQSYSQSFITETWRRFFNVLTAQLSESFELEREKCLNSDNQRTLAPHQKTEMEERRRKLNAERQELEESTAATFVEQQQQQKKEELYDDPF